MEDMYLFIIVIIALSLIYNGYKRKKNYDIKRLELELEHKKIDLETKKIDYARHVSKDQKHV
ncbi:hypothetical protein RYX45_00655 [Alkalihalophilus pseudofirmus]|uniref:Uncharacterized protein n=1 Tax=Alkalihalophilus pseudofirmus TaxID=79885 RepID=A0AAJ2NMI7_ALKPS|nr:hypothetical protein [Alkalihalophilus pseudofirmus]MDV2883670.1 hypothetical protein [Alkalihalophilus pseudofirmus]WEG17799.1 hypothetical protein PQ478_04725 [Alkalihalophilus pseudofirmus]